MASPLHSKIPSFLLLSFLIGIPRLFTLTVSDSLFLSHYDASAIPWAYLGRALVIPLLGALLFQLEKHLSNRKVLIGLLVFLTLVLVAFVAVFRLTAWDWPYLALLVWVSAEWTLSGMVFWNTANRHFTLREGKRAFGIISTGEVVATILGGFLVPVLLQVLSPPDLLYLSMAGHLLALGLLGLMGDGEPAPLRSRRRTKPLSSRDLFRSPYIVGLFGLTALDFLVHYFTDNAFFVQVQVLYQGASLTAFLGTFLGFLGIATLLFKLLVTPVLVQRIGVGPSLALGPMVVGLLGLVTVAVCFLPSGAALVVPLLIATKFVQMLNSEALFGPLYYLLFQPLPPGERTRVQNFSEAVPGRIVGGVGGALLLSLAGLADIVVWLGLGLVLLCVAWWWLTGRTTREYWKVLQSNTETRLLPGLKTSTTVPAKDFEEAFARLEFWIGLSADWAREPRFALAPWMPAVLKEEVNQSVGLLLGVLQREHPLEPMGGIREGLISTDAALRSYALESLENLLDSKRRSRVLSLLENGNSTGGVFLTRLEKAPQGAVRPLFGALEDPSNEGILFLKSVPLFQQVPYWYLPLVLEQTVAEAFHKDDDILCQGASGESLYLIHSGRVKVHADGRELAQLGRGSLFGEYAVLDPSPRSATITALEPVTTLRLDGAALFPLLLNHLPVLVGIVQLLCLRLTASAYWAVETQSFPLFEGLEPQAEAALKRWGSTESLAEGERWLADGEPPPGVAWVLKGRLGWQGTALEAGSLLEVAALAHRPLQGEVWAQADTELFVVPPELYLQSLALRPELLGLFLKSLVSRLKASPKL